MKSAITKQIKIEEIIITLQQKRMRNIRLRVCQNGEVRLSAPRYVSLSYLRNFLSGKIEWIKQQQEAQKNRPHLGVKTFAQNEKHSLFGKEFELEIISGTKSQVSLQEDKLVLVSKKVGDVKEYQKILDNFYRQNLEPKITEIIAHYEKIMGVKPAEFRIKKMKTRWGTCAIKARRIWINLELAKTHPKCLEFIVVHEMTHLLERKHNKRFFALMDKFMADWRSWDKELKNKRLLPS